jgi:hypothetical protein
MKRVVTGHDANGKAIFVSQGEPGHRFDVTALGWRELWATFPEDTLPHRAPAAEPSRDPRWTSLYPKVGQSVLRILEYRPEEAVARGDSSVWDDQELAFVEQQMPGLLASLEPEAPGMHTTDSVDYGIVLSGRIGLELDDGATVELEAGDVVVQNGTRHAWRPRERTVMAFVMIGVERRQEQES